MLVDRLDLTPEEFHHLTGWEIKPEGACKDSVCVPLGDEGFSLLPVAERLGMAVVGQADVGLWSIGPETIGGRALTSVDASGFSLPDLDGHEFSLDSLRGQKVALVSWAPY